MGRIMFLFGTNADPENADPWHVEFCRGNISGGKLVSGLEG